MKLITRIILGYGLLLALSAGGAVLAFVGVQRATAQLERVELAHTLHGRYLALSNHAYHLFKQFGDAILIGDLDLDRGETDLRESLEREFRAIARDIGREIEMAGDEELEELETLRELERVLDTLIREHYAILALRRAGATPESLSPRLLRLHEQSIDIEFNGLVRRAIEEEEREVRETRLAATQRLQRMELAAGAFMLLALLASTLAIIALVRETRGPIRRLLRAAGAIADGRPAAHIEESGPQELRALARALNLMADEVRRREATLTEMNRDLEQAIGQRTAELQQAVAALRDNEARRRQMLADVSHELRTPLTIIRGEADVALRGAAKPASVYQEALERTRSAAEHCGRIVNDLLFIARQEVGAANMRIESVDLAALLAATVSDICTLAAHDGARVEFAGNVERAIVGADPVRIRQVLMILIENAIHYGGDRIRVALEPLASGYLVCVADNGPGMSESDRDHAFERFFRGSNASQRYERGTGLGLPVARAIVEAHGGEIALHSEPGHGVTVQFTLPARPVLRAVS